MKKEPEKKSGIPIAVIGLVFVLMIGGGVWFYSTSSKPKSIANNGGPTNTVKTPSIPTNAPRGAEPPNQSGSPTSPVTVEEFADFQCPQCAAKHSVMNEVKSLYGSRIRFIYRNFPLPMHDKSYDAAVAAEAAGMQGKFWDMQNLLFINQQAWASSANPKQVWLDYAVKLGLDIDKFQNDMAGIATKNRVNEDVARGKALGVNSTPSLYINNVAVPFEEMTVSALKPRIDAELQKAMPQKSSPANVAPAPGTGGDNSN